MSTYWSVGAKVPYGTVTRVVHDDRPPGIRSSLVADLHDAPWRRRLLLLGVMVWLAYEWGPGNETVTPWLLARLLRDHEGGGAVALTVAVGAGFTAVQQLLSGLTALAGFAMFDRTASAAWRRLVGTRGSPPPAGGRSAGRRAGHSRSASGRRPSR